MPGADEGPSRLWYFVAAILAGASIGMIAWCIATLVGRVQSPTGMFHLARFSAPGEMAFRAGSPGTYNLYVRREDRRGRRPETWDVHVRRLADNGLVPVSSSKADMTLTINDEQFVAVRRFEVNTPGQYAVTVACDEPHARARMAVGPWGMRGFLGFMGRIAMIPLVLLFGGGGALAIFLVTLLKRRSARKRTGPPCPPQDPPPPPPHGGSAGPAPFPPAARR
ncbi:MAG: hypothetical protein ACOC8F_06380 [Planctomycetota bacterium]